MFQIKKLLQLLTLRLGGLFPADRRIAALQLLGKMSRATSILIDRVVEIYRTDPIIRHQVTSLRGLTDEFAAMAISANVPLPDLLARCHQTLEEVGLDVPLVVGVVIPVQPEEMSPMVTPPPPARRPHSGPLGRYYDGRNSVN